MKCQKHLFSLDPHIHYLNCAYKTPLMKSAEEAAIKSIQRERNPAEISVSDFFSIQEEIKSSYSSIIKAAQSQIALIPSTTYGFASVLNNIKGKTNGNAIIVKEAFPSGYYSLENWCKRENNNLKIIHPPQNTRQVGEKWNELLLDAITNDTSIVLIPTVHWMSGLKFDLQSIGQKCAQVGAKFIVDGTQSVGALPIDVEAYKITALICATYKWLFGPYSLGLLYVNEELNHGTPLEESWMNRKNAQNFRSLTDYEPAYTPGAGRYNVGQSSNFILLPILKESLAQINTWTVPAIQLYCKNLIQELKEFVSEIGISFEEEKYFANHLFSMQLTSKLDETRLKENLEKGNLILSIRGDHLRISTNVFNDKEDMDALIQAIKNSMD